VYLIEKKSALETEQKYYIGVRSCESLIANDDYMGSSKYLTEEVDKLGKQSFNKIILKRFENREDAYEYEIHMHKEFDVVNNPIFFNKANQTSFGFGGGIGENNPWYGKEHSEEWKKQKSVAMKGNKNASGYKHTEEAKKKIKEKRAKQVFTKEDLNKLKGKTPWNKGKTGTFFHTEEHKQKMSIRSKGNKYSIGRVLSEEEKRIKSEKNLGLIWMNDGNRNYRIRPENVHMKKEQGLIMGFFKKKVGV
jgi:hypothetical protein